MKRRFNVIDLYAGGGGISEGFHRAGFDIVAYIEKNRHACNTLRTRCAYWELKRRKKNYIYNNYLKSNISLSELHSYINKKRVINLDLSDEMLSKIVFDIRNNMEYMNVKKIDAFIGGPPCQAYSLVGRARDPYNMEKDPRNKLYRYYVDLLKIFKPSIFVFENVPGVLSAGKKQLFKDIRAYFEEAGYELDYRILDAADFMVLQRRKRVILIGWKKSLKLTYPDFQSIQKSYTIRDIFEDLPSLSPGQKIEIGDYVCNAGKYLIESGIRRNEDTLIQHITRPITEHDRKIYKIAIEKWDSYNKRLKYTDIPRELRTHRNLKSFLDRFKVVAGNLPYSHTLVAHIAKDGHYYIHPDINQLRSISIREAARIQSFPDDYKFEGSRTSIFTQIGNAVPPIMAEKIAEKIKEMLL